MNLNGVILIKNKSLYKTDVFLAAEVNTKTSVVAEESIVMAPLVYI